MSNPEYGALAAEFACMRDRPVEELARCLRERGVSPIGAIYVITRVLDLSLSEGKHLLLTSPSWQDQEPEWQAFHDSLEMHLLHTIVGRVVAQVGRIHNTFGGNVTSTNGELEIQFTNGNAMLIGTNDTLGSIRWSWGRWVDLYGDEKSEDMVEFAAEHGRPMYFDLGAEGPYSGLIGQSVRTYATHSDSSGRGAVEMLKIWIGGIRVTCEYHTDGLVVDVEARRLVSTLSQLSAIDAGKPIMRTDNEYPCVCCGRLVHEEPPGSHMICSVCLWEDDSVQLRWPDDPVGPNHGPGGDRRSGVPERIASMLEGSCH